MTLKDLKNEIEGCDMISRKRNGNILFRKACLYKFGKTTDDFVKRVTDQLDELVMVYEPVAQGEHWAPFRRGAGIAKQTHWYLEIKVHG